MTNTSDDPAASIPSTGCLLGVDFGTRRVGFAMSDDQQTFAAPLQTYTRTVESIDAKHLVELCEDYRIKGIVVGLALHISGEESRISHLAREYGEWAAKATGLPVAYWDERFSSATADVKLMAAGQVETRKDSRRDMLAAQSILESYLAAEDRTATPSDLRSSIGHH